MRYIYITKAIKDGSFYRARTCRVQEGQGVQYELEDAAFECVFLSKKKAVETARAWNTTFAKERSEKINEFLKDHEEKDRICNLIYYGYDPVTVTIDGSTMTLKDEDNGLTAVIYRCGHWAINAEKTGARVMSGVGYDIHTAWEELRRGKKFSFKEKRFEE